MDVIIKLKNINGFKLNQLEKFLKAEKVDFEILETEDE